MNITRVIIGRGIAAASAAHRCTIRSQVKVVTGVVNRIDFGSRQFRNYATRISIREPAKLEGKLENMDEGVLPPPNRSTTPSQVLKKRPTRKKQSLKKLEELSKQGFFNINAFATAEEYDLEDLLEALKAQNLYTLKKFFSTDNFDAKQDVLHVGAKYQLDKEPREMFFFREGSVVMWNFNEIEVNNVLSFLRPFEKDPYLRPLVRGESEVMPYTYIPQETLDVEGDLVSDASTDKVRAFFNGGKIFLTQGEENFYEKYTFSNALATSIKLGIWEATLDRYIDSMEFLTEDLKKGRRIRLTRDDVLRKTGELFALRHVINLSSDLLDIPDFYWDHEELETLYSQMCTYFSVNRRTKVMNEKINHCVELAELVSHNLNDAHHIRLEWMIIILIMVEVGFEIMHYVDRIYSAKEEEVITYDTGKGGTTLLLQ